MRIEETPVHEERITGPGAWRKSDFPTLDSQVYRLREETLAEMERAMENIRRAGKDLLSLEKADFPLPSFEADAARLRHDLRKGAGFVIVKGLPVAAGAAPDGRGYGGQAGAERRFWSAGEASLIYWGIGAHLGTTLPQNVPGDRLYAVRDEGYKIEKDWGAVGVRFSKTTEGLNFHTDSAPALMGNTPDIVGLLALEVAKQGGASALVSAQSAHNVMLAEQPGHLARLYRSYHFDRRAELRPGEPSTLVAPVFAWKSELQARYFRFYIPQGHQIAGAPLTEADVAALDSLDQVMNREELQVHFEMERGDMQFVNNTFILHSRTAYVDHPEAERRRHLKRLWLRHL